MSGQTPSEAAGRRVYTPQELADLLHVSLAWVQKQVTGRKIPYTKIGRLTRFTEEHVEAILTADEQPAITERPMLGLPRTKRLAAVRTPKRGAA